MLVFSDAVTWLVGIPFSFFVNSVEHPFVCAKAKHSDRVLSWVVNINLKLIIDSIPNL